MVSKSAVFVPLLWLVNCCACWVFTEIKYPLEKMGENDSDLGVYGEELSPEEYKRLLVQGKLSLIYPGTKWCGPGDVAESYDDLGSSIEADRCCREHDHCPDIIPAGETKYNLTNTAYYSKLSCKCDDGFRNCLHNANTTTASQVGVLYFNVIGTECFRNDYPITGCAKKSGWLNQKCVQYTYDKNGEKRYQWFDVPNY